MFEFHETAAGTWKETHMNVLVYLIPAALFLGGLGLLAFLWSLKNGQYEDMEGAANRILINDDDQSIPPA